MLVGHVDAELRSLRLHEAVAARLDVALVDAARARVCGWREDGRIHPTWADAWLDVLSRPLDEIRAVLRSTDEWAVAMRQSTPFAGVLTPQERWSILRSLG
jgi:hypothetical protein